MPTTYTATLAETGVPAKYNEKGVFAIVTSFTLDSVASGDTINMCKMQSGVTVIGGTLIVGGTGLGSSTTIAVGDSGSTTSLLAATSTSSAGGTSLIKLKTYTANDTIKLTVGGATATGLVQLVLLCTADNVDLS